MSTTHANHRLALIILLLLLLPVAVSAESLQEGIHLVRPDSQYISHDYAVPEYLTVEDLTFISCLEENYSLQNSLLCLDDNSFEDLQTFPWSNQDNCYISSFNLEDFACERLIIQAAYTIDDESYKMTKHLRVNKLSKVLDNIIDTQYSDGGWKDPLSTAYGIWALAHFKDIYSYELDLALDWLKLNRNEDQKCWPESPCNVELSSNILALLTLSNYTDAKRVVNDARNWFEELQNNYESGDEWNISVVPTNNDTLASLIAYNQELLDENFTIPEDGINYTIDVEEGNELIVIADDYVIVTIYNQEGDFLTSYQGDNLSYTTPGPCWSINRKGEPCDSTVSIFAITADIDEDQKDLAKDWSREQLKRGQVLGHYYGDENDYFYDFTAEDDDEEEEAAYNEERNALITDTALYLYNLYDDDYEEDDNSNTIKQVIDWLLYKQNNEGSWGGNTTGEKAVPSAFATIALTKAGYNRTSEPIADAEEWASDNEDNITDNNTAALSSAFYILKEYARPLLTTNPKVLIVNQTQITFQLFNPTTFQLNDLEYEFSDELEDQLSIEKKEELDAYSYRRLRITKTATSAANVFGYLTITNLGDPIAKIPIIVSDVPTLKITTPETISVFGKNGELTITAEKSNHAFVCSATWNSNEISSPGSIKLTKTTATLPISFTQAQTKEDSYTGKLACTAAGRTITLPLSIYVNRYAKDPLTITPEDLVINDTTTNPQFILTNNLDRDLEVSISLDRYGSYFGFRDTLLLDPNQAYNFTLTNNLPTDLNLTSSVLLNFNVFDRTESVSMLIDITEQQPEQQSLLGALLPLLIILIILSVIGYFIWKFRNVIFAELNKLNYWRVKQEKKQESKRITSLKKTEQHQAIVNLYNIMKFQNKDEKEIASRLTANFPKDAVQQALENAGIPLAILKDEPEKAE